MIICDYEKCTGCSACYNICPKQSIQMTEQLHGFQYPVVNEQSCIRCGLCSKVCPVINAVQPHEHLAVYAALVKNDEERAKSTSGGVFACLAQSVIKNGGSIFGAVLDDDMVVRHIEAVDEAGLDRIRGSKYVQSEIGSCYKQAEKRLKEGKRVLFSGTPCQIAGLRSYLKKDYDNLLTVDILCHGVPSPGIFRKYVASEEKRAGSKMQEMLFRSKRVGWKKIFSVRTFVSGTEADWSDTFVPGFLKNYYLRESCYQCQYTSENRQGDITLGDYWGYKESAPDYIEDDDKGISLVIVNTQKGRASFDKVRKNLAIAKRSMEDAKKGNMVLYGSCSKPQDYLTFWEDEEALDWAQLCKIYIENQDTSEWMSQDRRNYYNRPFMERHRRHVIECRINVLKSEFAKKFAFWYQLYLKMKGRL